MYLRQLTQAAFKNPCVNSRCNAVYNNIVKKPHNNFSTSRACYLFYEPDNRGEGYRLEVSTAFINIISLLL